jgi:hypothetical protein
MNLNVRVTDAWDAQAETRYLKLEAGMLSKLLAGGVGGFICAMFAFMNVAIITESSDLRLLGFVGCWIAAVSIALGSTSTLKAWQNLLFCTAFLFFLLPMLGGLRISLDFLDKAESGAASLPYFALVAGMLIVIGGAVFWGVGSLLGRDRRS